MASRSTRSSETLKSCRTRRRISSWIAASLVMGASPAPIDVRRASSASSAEAATRSWYRLLAQGVALRVPVPTGSITDLTVVLRRAATVDDVNAAALGTAAASITDGLAAPGGTSLAIVRSVAGASRTLGLDINPRDLGGTVTVRNLARVARPPVHPASSEPA